MGGPFILVGVRELADFIIGNRRATCLVEEAPSRVKPAHRFPSMNFRDSMAIYFGSKQDLGPLGPHPSPAAPG